MKTLRTLKNLRTRFLYDKEIVDALDEAIKVVEVYREAREDKESEEGRREYYAELAAEREGKE